MEKVIAVTGGSSGIGRAVVSLLRLRGEKVYSLSRRASGIGYELPCDVTDRQTVDAAIKKIASAEGRIDVLVNCAGFGISGACEYTDSEDAHRQLEVNLFGISNMVNAALPYLREGGRIVNISSVAAVVPIPFQAWYSASKAAVNSYSMALANELCRFGISVCAVMPGDTKTGFTEARSENHMGDDVYGGAIGRSVEKMKRDERGGSPPELVAKTVVRAVTAKRVRPLYTCGFGNKAVVAAMRLLPAAVANRLIGRLYAG